MIRSATALLLLLTLSLLSGCVIGRRTVDAPMPQTAGTGGKGEFYLGSIEDNRVFLDDPGQPSTPSVDGDLDETPESVLVTLIGRQRNSYGMAMGDVALPEGETVMSRTRQLLEEGLRRRGYTLSDNPNAPDSASVEIDRYWAWVTPGFFTISLESQIECTLTIKTPGGIRTVLVKGYGLAEDLGANDYLWRTSYGNAYTAFLDDFDKQMTEQGL
jgi:hypothetical protein